MIRIFSKIRQKLLTENKLAKYSIYAFGEILLVMVGILLALQVNNWNEDRKMEKLEFKYLERLKRDLIQDTLYYESRIQKAKDAIQSNTKAIQMAYEIQQNLDDVYHLLSLHPYLTQHLTIQDGTYLEMTNAGNLNILQNEELKISMASLYRTANEAKKQVKESNEFTVGVLTDLSTTLAMNKYMPFPWKSELFNKAEMFNDSDWEFINEPTSYKFRLLENCLSIYITKHNTLLPFYTDLKSKSVALVKMVSKEVVRHNQ